MKKFSILLVLLVLSFGTTVFALANPSAVYCNEMNREFGGYTYAVQSDADSNEYGVCTMPDGTQCDAWAFLDGKCGQNFSYCAKNGYAITTVSKDSTEYAACIRPGAPDKAKAPGAASSQEIPVMELMNLGGKLGGSITPGSVESQLNRMVSKTEAGSAMAQSQYDASDFSSWDWRNPPAGTAYAASNFPYFDGWVTRVKDQAACGSCWAFGIMGTLEAKYNIVMNESRLGPDLSEQDAVSCSGAGSCAGGSPWSTLYYARNDGVADESCFPYTATDENCLDRCADHSNRSWTITSFQAAYSASDAEMKQMLIDDGPLSIVVNASEWSYGGGILNCTQPPAGLDHVVILVGYNDTGGYWIIKNSWGDSWGEDGYIRAAFGCFGIGSEVESVDSVTPPDFKPAITVNAPTQDTSPVDPVLFNFTVNNRVSPTSTCDLIVNGAIVNTTSADSGSPAVMSYWVPLGVQNTWSIRCWETDLGIITSSQTRNLGVFISIQSPSNSSYNVSSLPLNYEVTDASACWYSLDNAPNVTLPGCGNTTLEPLSDGGHTVFVYDNDTGGTVHYNSVSFTVDTVAPAVTLNSPADLSQLNSSIVAFNFTAVDSISATMNCSIFLDGMLNQSNASTSNNTATIFTIMDIPNGNHSWYVRCTDDANNAGTSAPMGFTLYNYCPVITSSGTYTQTTNSIGAPNSASPESGTVCVKITVSDVVFDCNGYNITNDWTGRTTYGIMVFGATGPTTNVTVKNCPSISNYSYGVDMIASNSSVSNVTAHNNSQYDFGTGASNCTITSGTSYGSPYGFYVTGSGNNIIGNVAHDDSVAAFFATDNSNDNSFINNSAYNSAYGFLVSAGYIPASGNKFLNNSAYNNSNYQIRLAGSSSGLIYNNIFNATGSQGIAYDSGTDFWNTTKDCSNNNILGGNCIGGNWYSNYTGVSTDGSGIGSTTYPVYGGSDIDYLPLTDEVGSALAVTTNPAGTLDASTVSGIAGYCNITTNGSTAYAINYTWFLNNALNASGVFSSLGSSIILGTAGRTFAYDAGFTNPTNANDGNYATKASYTAFSTASFYWNYTNPASSTNATLWQTKHGSQATNNVTLPASCANRATIQLKITANNSNSSGGSQQLSASANGRTFANDTSVGNLNWAKPGNANVSDNIYAIATSPGNGSRQQTVYLKATNFSFNIPAGATITGIQARIDKNTTSTTANDTVVKLVKNGVIGGTNHQNTTAWPLSKTTVRYGNSTDLWGLAWTPSDINNASFGIAFSASRMTGTGSRTLQVDYINLTIYYNTATTTNYSQSSKFCYDGSAWISVGTNSTATNNFSAADVYDQDVYFTISGGSSSGINYLVNNLTASFADGQTWTFQCTATDGTSVWNQNATPVVLTGPNVAVTLNSPADLSLSSSASVAFNFTATDALSATMGCSIYLDGSLNQTNSSVANNTATVFTITGIANGNHAWYVACKDSANNTGTSGTRNFTVDATAPTVTLNSPANLSLSNSSSVTFNFTATDALSATMSCSIYLDGTLNQSNASTSNNTATIFTITGIANGNHAWYVACKDSANNTGTSATRNFTIATNTTPSITLNYPANASLLGTPTLDASSSATTDFNFTATNPQPGTMSCSLYLNGILNSTNPSVANNTLTNFTLSGLAEGLYYWKVNCSTVYASVVSETRNFTLYRPRIRFVQVTDVHIIAGPMGLTSQTGYDGRTDNCLSGYLGDYPAFYALYCNTTNYGSNGGSTAPTIAMNATIGVINGYPLNFTVFTGDIVAPYTYDSNKTKSLDIFQMLAGNLAQPYYVSGAYYHDSVSDSASFAEYTARFGNLSRYFIMDRSLFVILSETGSDSHISSTNRVNLTFLNQTLNAFKDQGYAVFVLTHTPPTSSIFRGSDDANFRSVMESYVNDYTASVVICGHTHVNDYVKINSVHYISTTASMNYPTELRIVDVYDDHIHAYMSSILSPEINNVSETLVDGYVAQGTLISGATKQTFVGTASDRDIYIYFDIPVVTLNSPANLSILNSSTGTFNFTAINNISATMNCSIYLDGVLNKTNSSVANNTATVFTITGLANGNHAWYVQCKDSANNTGTSATRNFTVSMAAPAVTLNSPASGALLNSSMLAFNFTAINNISATMNCSIYLDGTLNQSNASTSNNTATIFTITGIANGNHAWYVQCKDSANNTGTSSTWNFTMQANGMNGSLNVTTIPAGTLDAGNVSGIAGYCNITTNGSTAYAINYTWFVNGTVNASGAFSSLGSSIILGTAGRTFAYDTGFTNPANANDGNYSTKATYTAFSTASFYWNYTNPASSTNATLWQTKHGSQATSNVTLPAACANQATIQLKIMANNSNASADGNSVVVAFNSSTNWTVPAGVTSVKVLVVAGGGGSGGGGNYPGAGGGAGGVLYNASYATTPGTNITVTVGTGGAGATGVTAHSSNGTNSVFGTMTALGGGGGGSAQNRNGYNGGSGGGRGSYSTLDGSPGSGTAGHGNNGANSSNYGAGGGGGKAAAGVAGAGTTTTTGAGGAGGNGTYYGDIFGASYGASGYFGGGGGGAGRGISGGAGGNGGGGAGATYATGNRYGTPGTNGTGGGAGGSCGSSQTGGSLGGNGVVLIQYTTSPSVTNYSQSSKFCYDGSAWISVGTNSTATNNFSAADVYDQDVYFSISNGSSSGINYLVNNLTASFANGQNWTFQCTATDGTTIWKQNATPVILAAG